MRWDRREFLKYSGLGAAAVTALPLGRRALAADANTLTIAYNVALPSWDPTVGPSAVNPTIQSRASRSAVSRSESRWQAWIQTMSGVVPCSSHFAR